MGGGFWDFQGCVGNLAEGSKQQTTEIERWDFQQKQCKRNTCDGGIPTILWMAAYCVSTRRRHVLISQSIFIEYFIINTNNKEQKKKLFIVELVDSGGMR